MKFIFLLLLLSTLKQGYAQDKPLMPSRPYKDAALLDIQLSKTLNESRMGMWENGDYKIFVEIQPMEEDFRKDYESLMHATAHQYKNDTAAIARCKVYAARYLVADNQLKAAGKEFDLRKLVLYIGPDNEAQNQGNSSTVDLHIRQLVENGKAAVYYQGERIYTLKKQVLADYVMSNIKIYYDQTDNCAYNYFGHINW